MQGPALAQEVTGVHIATCVGYRGPIAQKGSVKYSPNGVMKFNLDFEPDTMPAGTKVTLSTYYPWDDKSAPPLDGDGNRINYTTAQIDRFTMQLKRIPASKKGNTTMYGAFEVLNAFVLDANKQKVGLDFDALVGKRCKIEMEEGFVKKIWVDEEVFRTPAPVKNIQSQSTETTGVVRQPATAARNTPRTAARAAQQVSTTLPPSLVEFKNQWLDLLVKNGAEIGVTKEKLSALIQRQGAKKFADLQPDQAINVFSDIVVMINEGNSGSNLPYMPDLPRDSETWAPSAEGFVQYYGSIRTLPPEEAEPDLDVDPDDEI